MAQSLAMRATSLATSAALLALVGAAALSVSWTVSRFATPPEGPVILSEPEPVTPPPTLVIPRVHPIDTSRPAAQSDEPATTIAVSTDPNSIGTVVDVRPPTISNPHWLQTPRDLARFYPARAVRREIEGVAQLDCLVTAAGTLRCTVVSETPANWGFGAAALQIAESYRMAPAMRDGVAVEGRYRMHVPFQLGR